MTARLSHRALPCRAPMPTPPSLEEVAEAGPGRDAGDLREAAELADRRPGSHAESLWLGGGSPGRAAAGAGGGGGGGGGGWGGRRRGGRCRAPPKDHRPRQGPLPGVPARRAGEEPMVPRVRRDVNTLA